jgi:hypothetical protein
MNQINLSDGVDAAPLKKADAPDLIGAGSTP